jgi:ParB family chromosome partitioning protein
MGRGLAAILPQAGEIGEPYFREVPINLVLPNPDQPRKRFDPESISALASSLQETGMIQPLIVRPLPDGRYELIAGERRWRAAQEAGIESVSVLLRTGDEVKRLQMALIENVAREDLNPVDDARACVALIEDLGVTKEELSRQLGRSRSALSNLIRILDLPDDALELISEGKLSEGHGRALLMSKDDAQRKALAARAVREGWSVRETERRATGEAAGGRRAKVVLHPDQAEAISKAEDELESALGTGVKVKPAGKKLRLEIVFDDLDDLLEFARRR